MTLELFRQEVQTIFPIKFSETLIVDDDPSVNGSLDGVEKIINRAISTVLSKYQKIESIEIVGSQILTRAASILKCVTSANVINSSVISVWNTMQIPDSYIGTVKHYFTPHDKMLRLYPIDASVYVEYVVAYDVMNVTDLEGIILDLAIEYANCLLKIKEGYLGTAASLTVLPFEFNYGAMKEEGIQEKASIEEKLDDLSSGSLAIRIN